MQKQVMLEEMRHHFANSLQIIASIVITDDGMITSEKAVSLGLIVTELVINALKYAFPDREAEALILVTYEIDILDWKLIVSDNGVGKSEFDHRFRGRSRHDHRQGAIEATRRADRYHQQPQRPDRFDNARDLHLAHAASRVNPRVTAHGPDHRTTKHA
jgi:hypothetical protein